MIVKLREGVYMYAPVGMEVFVCEITHDESPLCIFMGYGQTVQRLQWSDLTEERKVCTKCGQDIYPRDLFISYSKL